jgi:hypothetical protein
MNKKNKKDGPYLHDVLDEEWEPIDDAEEDFSEELLELEHKYKENVQLIEGILEQNMIILIPCMERFVENFKALDRATKKLCALRQKLDLEDDCDCDDDCC